MTKTQISEDGVSNLGSGNNVNGSIINEYGKFDVGVAFGTAGIGKDDIREASFILSHTTTDLTYDFLSAQDFAVRLTSVGDEDGCRNNSLKLGGTSPEGLPEDPNSPPAAVDDVAATDEGTPVTVALLANDSDPDGDALTLTSAGGQAPGSTSPSPRLAAGSARLRSAPMACSPSTRAPPNRSRRRQVGYRHRHLRDQRRQWRQPPPPRRPSPSTA